MYLKEGPNGFLSVMSGPFADDPLIIDKVDDALKKILGDLPVVEGEALGLECLPPRYIEAGGR